MIQTEFPLVHHERAIHEYNSFIIWNILLSSKSRIAEWEIRVKLIPRRFPKLRSRKKNPLGLPSNASPFKTSLTASYSETMTTLSQPILRPTIEPYVFFNSSPRRWIFFVECNFRISCKQPIIGNHGGPVYEDILTKSLEIYEEKEFYVENTLFRRSIPRCFSWKNYRNTPSYIFWRSFLNNSAFRGNKNTTWETFVTLIIFVIHWTA